VNQQIRPLTTKEQIQSLVGEMQNQLQVMFDEGNRCGDRSEVAWANSLIDLVNEIDKLSELIS
jgi:hypothetical protein